MKSLRFAASTLSFLSLIGIAALTSACVGEYKWIPAPYQDSDRDSLPDPEPEPEVSGRPDPTDPTNPGAIEPYATGAGVFGEHGLQKSDSYAPKACTGMSSASAPAVLCVSAAAADASGDGTAARPYKSIGAAVQAARNGDTVQVTSGTYRESVRVIAKSIQLLGAFSPDFGSRDHSIAASLSRVDGMLSSGVTEPVISLLDAGTTVVDGFLLTGGGGRRNETDSGGGGIYCSGYNYEFTLATHPVISNNVIEGNNVRMAGDHSRIRGGGIYSDGCARITVANNIISGNLAGRGAGLFVNLDSTDGFALIRNNLIEGNLGNSDHGGGLFLTNGTIEVIGNLIRGNLVGEGGHEGWGGGVYFEGGGEFMGSGIPTRGRMAFNVITDNSAVSLGSGVFVDNGAKVTLEHELIFRNRCAANGGAALYVDGYTSDARTGSEMVVRHSTIANHACVGGRGGNGLLAESSGTRAVVENSIFWDNGENEFLTADSATIDANHSLTSTSVAGTGNISADPLFADAANGDYHLMSASGRYSSGANGGRGGWVTDAQHSPGIDAGRVSTSFRFESAPNGSRANLGAYGDTWQASQSR